MAGVVRDEQVQYWFCGVCNKNFPASELSGPYRACKLCTKWGRDKDPEVPKKDFNGKCRQCGKECKQETLNGNTGYCKSCYFISPSLLGIKKG